MTASLVTLTFHSVIPGRRISGEPGIRRLRREIPGSPFGRPGMTPSEADVRETTLDRLAARGGGFQADRVDIGLVGLLRAALEHRRARDERIGAGCGEKPPPLSSWLSAFAL